MNNLTAWLHGFLPPALNAGRRERVYSCIGAGLGLLLTEWISHLALGGFNPWFIAPMGASAVLLFAVPFSPLAQPWSILSGNLVSAAIGVGCAHYIASPALATSLAVALAIAAMFQLRCLHPPGGAVAMTAVLGGPAITRLGYHFILFPVAVNSAVLLGMALLFNNLLHRRYPHLPHAHPNAHHTADPMPSERNGISRQDLEQSLANFGEELDISEEDLLSIIADAEKRAQQRHFAGIRCEDIMSRDVIRVDLHAPLQEAWDKLSYHKVKALPVTDPTRQVVGMITLHDFFLTESARRSGAPAWRQQAVADVMTRHVQCVAAHQPISDLASVFSDGGLHHMPVVDADRQLVGMITQSDLIAALFKS
ncbi:HPP family protein [Paludibacterium purpuratum]|uniref:CBS domain-containing membrane protein n=1 Tax=Paludibacterium purpuratum TaxID=1144873 RepID=A0A4R7B913_9NEIS|nr:HPP family protein [Paludibacterium purpuratum]TDR80077.1 CBS domain-containing membrane protein [Paludibacterium purpuratum]